MCDRVSEQGPDNGTQLVRQKRQGLGYYRGRGQTSSGELEVCWQSGLPKMGNTGMGLYVLLPEGLKEVGT